ncbi:MAG TPA: DinB family protein [Vicinamibacteria bacterium]|nr:DinB family protein [Vicinamibacteria bacterium]
MIARIWDGSTRAKHGDEYLEYLRRTGVAECTSTQGNRGVWVLRRAEGGEARFRFVSIWDSMDAVTRFAGSEPEKARYYPDDERFLLALEPRVEHFEVAIAADAPSREAAELADELKRLWHGDAWHGPALAELLADVTADRAATRVIPGGHTVWELLLHVTAWSDVFRRRIDGKAVEEPEEGDFPAAPEASAQGWAEARVRAERVHERLTASVDALTAAALDATTPGRPFSVRFLVRSAIRHVVYHSGQIGLLKKGW